MSPIKLQGTNSAAAPGLTNDGDDGVVVGTDSVDISIGGASKVKVDSAGKVGIGTTTPAKLLDVEAAAGGNYIAHFRNGTSATPYGIHIEEPNSPGAGYPSFNITNNGGSTEYFRVDSGRGVTKLKMHSGAGIDFSATTDAAGKDNELLDDYEEGTFTPAYANGVDAGFGYAYQNGTYIKIGRMVYWEIYLDGNSGTSNANQLWITGFPFSQSNKNDRGGGNIAWCQWASGSYNLYHAPTTAQLNFYTASTAVSGNTALASGDAAHLFGSYMVD